MLSWFNILMSINVNLIQSVQNASKEPTPIACICILWHIVPLVPPSHNSKPIKYRILHNQAQYIITKKKKNTAVWPWSDVSYLQSWTKKPAMYAI